MGDDAAPGKELRGNGGRYAEKIGGIRADADQGIHISGAVPYSRKGCPVEPQS